MLMLEFFKGLQSDGLHILAVHPHKQRLQWDIPLLTIVALMMAVFIHSLLGAFFILLT